VHPPLRRHRTRRNVDILNLFGIANEVNADKSKLLTDFIPVKTWNVERAERVHRPGEALHGNPDNADIAGPDSIYDYYA
jgi:hypothetical protein